MLLAIVTGAIVTLGVIVARACWLAYLEWRVLRKIPHLPSSSNSLKGSLELVLDPDKIAHSLHAAAERLGTGIMSFRVFHIATVVVTDAALVQQALSLPKDPEVYKIFNMLTSPDGRQPNLLGHVSHDGYWRLISKGVAPAFSPRNLRAGFPQLVAVIDRLSAMLAALGPERYIDIDTALQRQSMEVIGCVGFSYDFGAVEGFAAAAAAGESPADVFASVRAGAQELTLLWNTPLRYRLRKILPAARRGRARHDAVQAHMRQVLEALRARGPPAADDVSIGAHLLRIRDPATGRGLTDEQLVGEIGVLLFAGFETTGPTMSWTLYLLARHPEVQARVEAELDAAGLLATIERPSPRALEFKDLSQLRYLGAVIKESMRLVPVVANGTVRASPTPFRLGGYDIPANTMLMLLTYGLHHSSRYWDRPQEFDPGRWAEPGADYWQQAAQAPASKAAAGGASRDSVMQAMDEEQPGQRARRFLPFSGGPRSCIGQNLASMTYTATLAVLISRFKFTLPQELDSDAALLHLQHDRITNQPRCSDGPGLPMRCIPRASAA